MATLDPLPPSLADTLARFPSPGERNIWLFTVAAQSRHVASPAKVHRFLQRIVAHTGWADRDFSREIDRAVTRAYNPGHRVHSVHSVQKVPHPKRLPWPAFDPSLWDRYSATPPIFTPDPIPVPPERVLDVLYAQDALLCLSLDIRAAVTQPRPQWRGMEAAMEFIVANPMSALSGRTKEGRLSQRCHDNATRSRIYQVIEFDRGTPQEQAALLSALHSDRTPLILAVWSGGKSIHGWFDVRQLTEADKRRFFAAACRLGADSSLWDPCKLVRMPAGRRANGHPQPILYFPKNAA